MRSRVFPRQAKGWWIVANADIKCPSCKVTFDHDCTDEVPSQDEEIEVTCPMCDAEIKTTAIWTLTFLYEELANPQQGDE